MIVYKHNKDGYFVKEHKCQPCPKTGGWLYPTKGTFTDIKPTLKKGFVPKWDGKKWLEIEDNRQKVFYNVKTRDRVFCQTIEKPENCTELEPTDVQVWSKDKWVDDKKLVAEKEKNKILMELQQTDLKMTRPLEEHYNLSIASKSIDEKNISKQVKELLALKKELRSKLK